MTNNLSEQEIFLEPGKDIVCRFSTDLHIDYINEFFTEFSGYEIHEVIGMSVDAMKHPSIPQTVNNIIERSVQQHKNINLILKNETRNGDYYWFMTDFKFNYDESGNLSSITYYRKSPPRLPIPALEKLYKKLVDIEKHASLDVAEKYLRGFLEERGMTMEEYTASLNVQDSIPEFFTITPKEEKKKSVLGRLFGK